MSVFGAYSSFFKNDVLLVDTSPVGRDRVYRVVGSERFVVIRNDYSTTNAPVTLTVGNAVINLLPYIRAAKETSKKAKRPWLTFERPHPPAPRKLSATRARHGHQQMCRLPNYRGTRTR